MGRGGGGEFFLKIMLGTLIRLKKSIFLVTNLDYIISVFQLLRQSVCRCHLYSFITTRARFLHVQHYHPLAGVDLLHPHHIPPPRGDRRENGTSDRLFLDDLNPDGDGS